MSWNFYTNESIEEPFVHDVGRFMNAIEIPGNSMAESLTKKVSVQSAKEDSSVGILASNKHLDDGVSCSGLWSPNNDVAQGNQELLSDPSGGLETCEMDSNVFRRLVTDQEQKEVSARG